MSRAKPGKVHNERSRASSNAPKDGRPGESGDEITPMQVLNIISQNIRR
jgi:hypothetical protein